MSAVAREPSVRLGQEAPDLHDDGPHAGWRVGPIFGHGPARDLDRSQHPVPCCGRCCHRQIVAARRSLGSGPQRPRLGVHRDMSARDPVTSEQEPAGALNVTVGSDARSRQRLVGTAAGRSRITAVLWAELVS